MRRWILSTLTLGFTLVPCTNLVNAQDASGPALRKLSVPAAQSRSIATKLSLIYRDVPGVQISPDAKNNQLVVMAPESAQRKIAADVQSLMNSEAVQQASATGPVHVQLKNVTWREFEDDLKRLAGLPLPITTTRNGERASFQLSAAPLQGTTVEVDRRRNMVTVMAAQQNQKGWQKVINTLDAPSHDQSKITELMRLENAEPAPIQRAIRLLGELDARRVKPITAENAFQNAVFQQDAAATPAAPAANAAPQNNDTDSDEQGGSGVIGDTQIQFVPELGTIIIRGAKRDVERVMEVIKEIEKQSDLTRPDIEVVNLRHADSNAVATLLKQLYDDVLSARQGEVSITALDSPNSLLLIGRAEAINGVRDLIAKVDIPVDETSRLRIFRLQHASASDAEETIRSFFVDRPGGSDDLRPGIGPRVRVLADYRTNSLIVSGAPRDMEEVTRLINDLDVQQVSAQSEIKIFPLTNAVAEDLAPVIQSAINGESESGGDSNVTTPSTSLSMVAVDGDGNQILDSGILAGAVITADPGANSIVVRAPAASMPLIGELIRQLDKAPGIDSLVKVFTIENGDAVQLTTALTQLFGDDAATSGTSIGAGNLGGLPTTTAGSDSSLVPLRFSTDLRTNSIIASGSAEDLEVVESILLRLDGAGFSERITEVIWLRHQASDTVAAAIQQYVQQRSQGVNTIQQFQQGGLGPYDLPDRDLVVVSEPVTNSLLLSVSPRLYEDVRGLIDKLDRRPPMVLIKVLLAEVSLDDIFEVGGEIGLQDSLMFDRGTASNAFPASTPGFNYNGNGTPNLSSFGKESLAGRGLTSFGVGTTNGNLNYGGFVLSAASESVSLLLRTLQDARRLQILSRPQVMTMDNTEALVQVGRTIAQVTGVIQNGISGNQVVTEPLQVGLIMQVRPRVGADGLIIMDIDATRSDRDASNGTQVPTGDGSVLIQDILVTTAQSTVAAYSGQTVIFGGLIQKTRSNFSRRVPYLADIPLLGYFFKYDQEFERRSEMLVIMTPMLVTGEEDLDYVKATESSRMSWCLADVVEMHGDVGLSGGYGLWGPATGGTIYPDLQPTVDQFHQGELMNGEEYCPPAGVNSSSVIISDQPTMIDAGSSLNDSPVIYESSTVPEHAMPRGIPQTRSNRVQPNGLPNAVAPQGTGQPRPGQPLNQHGNEGEVQWQSPPNLDVPNQSGNSRPPISGPAMNPYTQTGTESSANQVSWMQNANAGKTIDYAAASSDRPQRLGAVVPTAAEVQPAAQPVQAIPSISPQTWIR